MWKIPSAIVASVSAAVLAAGGATTAFAAPTAYPVEAPSPDTNATPDPHASMAGMDHDQMDHDEMAGMDHEASAQAQNEGPETGSQHSHGGSAAKDTPRPQGLVVGGFAMINGGVLLTAGLMRRRARLSTTRPSRTSRPAK